ncbi:conserved hypothetical protein [Verrucomicrobia bacterium]|nr:conserved hypothetical protein [Verrucomicrobiota bacterium]
MAADPQTKAAKLRRDYEAAKAQIQALGYILPGSLQKRLYRCGKPNCRCATHNLLHGPYYQWTRKIGGKTVNMNLEEEAAQKAREWIKNDKNLRKLCRRLERISAALLQTNSKVKKASQKP